MADYIKKEDAMELINKCVSHTSPKAKVMDFRHGEMNGLNWSCDIIEAMPSADVAPVRHGKYIGTEFDGYADGCPVYYEWKCSECGCVFEEEEPTYNYCPNCGARMDGEK